MKPIRFMCEARLKLSPAAICEHLLDLTQWPTFTGWGPLPGIKTAAFLQKNAAVVGTKIQVENRDGSQHLEEIVVWEPARCVRFLMQNFSPPLSRLAVGIEETWEFQVAGEETQVKRSLAMHAKTLWAWPVLWCLSFLLRQAIFRHLHHMQTQILTSESNF